MIVKDDYLDNDKQNILEEFENGEFQDVNVDFAKRKKRIASNS